MGLGVAVWASLPKFVSPPLNTQDSVEVADHLIPGVVILLVSVWALLATRSKPGGAAPGPGPSGPERGPSAAPFFAGLVVLLAGLWMLATHIPLVAQAFRGDAPWAGTIYHTSAALATFGLGLLWAVTHWSDLAALEAAGSAKKAKH